MPSPQTSYFSPTYTCSPFRTFDLFNCSYVNFYSLRETSLFAACRSISHGKLICQRSIAALLVAIFSRFSLPHRPMLDFPAARQSHTNPSDILTTRLIVTKQRAANADKKAYCMHHRKSVVVVVEIPGRARERSVRWSGLPTLANFCRATCRGRRTRGGNKVARASSETGLFPPPGDINFPRTFPRAIATA